MADSVQSWAGRTCLCLSGRVWWTTGFNVLIFLAGLRALPHELYEAAKLDGAGRWATFRLLTWPLIWPVTALVLTLQLILQLKVFDQVFVHSTDKREGLTDLRYAIETWFFTPSTFPDNQIPIVV